MKWKCDDCNINQPCVFIESDDGGVEPDHCPYGYVGVCNWRKDEQENNKRMDIKWK